MSPKLIAWVPCSRERHPSRGRQTLILQKGVKGRLLFIVFCHCANYLAFNAQNAHGLFLLHYCANKREDLPCAASDIAMDCFRSEKPKQIKLN